MECNMLLFRVDASNMKHCVEATFEQVASRIRTAESSECCSERRIRVLRPHEEDGAEEDQWFENLW